MKAVLLALLFAQVTQMPQKPVDVPLTQQQLQQPYQVPQVQQMQPGPSVPQNPQDWPKSCQRHHAEVNKCEAGLKSCDQRLVDRLQKRCMRDETKFTKQRGFE